MALAGAQHWTPRDSIEDDDEVTIQTMVENMESSGDIVGLAQLAKQLAQRSHGKPRGTSASNKRPSHIDKVAVKSEGSDSEEKPKREYEFSHTRILN